MVRVVVVDDGEIHDFDSVCATTNVGEHVLQEKLKIKYLSH